MASGPKVLRIGLVHAGRVIEERIIKLRTHVTIGQSEKSMTFIANVQIHPTTSDGPPPLGAARCV